MPTSPVPARVWVWMDFLTNSGSSCLFWKFSLCCLLKFQTWYFSEPNLESVIYFLSFININTTLATEASLLSFEKPLKWRSAKPWRWCPGVLSSPHGQSLAGHWFAVWLDRFQLPGFAAAASLFCGSPWPQVSAYHPFPPWLCLGCFVSLALSRFCSLWDIVRDSWISCLPCLSHSAPSLSHFFFDGLISHTFWLKTLFKISSRCGCAIVPCGCWIIIF